ncbi:hypothetical protein [Glacieibacterium frigidum]|uniref:Uncharacterized protein n=1 Tax=Glacieibacterium frigidum TaxID=2593303 RepID=A0A552UAA1_9SPHN|nr:hypothetical protein [Glacieibacterium frigidum]TRW15140.1 hypothetical protein FMM06_15980 [Glacieibacterium frigidum]
MIAEFAVEPTSIVASIHLFDNVTSRFGFDQGRTISDFAGGRDAWAERVRNAAASSLRPVERLRVADRLNQLRRTAGILRLREPYIGGPAEWEENIVREHARKPWDGVVSRSETCGGVPACAADRIGDSALFESGGIARQPRSEAALTNLVGRLLGNSRQLDLIDPYMSMTSRWVDPIASLIAVFTAGGRSVGDIALHMDEANQTNETDFVAECRRRLSPRLRGGVKITIFRWGRSDDRMHERAVITELGGYDINSGLDVCAGATTSVNRIGRIEAARIRDRYTANGPFPLRHRFTLVGEGPS